jgi:hypothetical protein
MPMDPLATAPLPHVPMCLDGTVYTRIKVLFQRGFICKTTRVHFFMLECLLYIKVGTSPSYNGTTGRGGQPV